MFKLRQSDTRHDWHSSRKLGQKSVSKEIGDNEGCAFGLPIMTNPSQWHMVTWM